MPRSLLFRVELRTLIPVSAATTAAAHATPSAATVCHATSSPFPWPQDPRIGNTADDDSLQLPVPAACSENVGEEMERSFAGVGIDPDSRQWLLPLAAATGKNPRDALLSCAREEEAKWGQEFRLRGLGCLHNLANSGGSRPAPDPLQPTGSSDTA